MIRLIAKILNRCAAAGYLHDDPVVLSNMIDALHPDNLSEKEKSKRENAQRRKALKELEKRGPTDFHKGSCRAAGRCILCCDVPEGFSSRNHKSERLWTALQSAR